MDEPREPTLLRSLWEGLSARTLGSSLAAIAFAALEFAFCCWYITPQRLAPIDPKIVMENVRDDYAKITVNALRLRYVNTQALSLVYIGASAARQALLNSETPRLIEDYLTAQVGERVTFHFLCADAETLEEGVMLSDQLPPNFRGVVVAVVSDYRNDERAKHLRKQDKVTVASRLGLESPSSDKLSEQLGEPTPKKTGIYFLDQINFFAVRRVAGARLFRVETRPYNFAMRTGRDDDEVMQKKVTLLWEAVRRDFETRAKIAILTQDRPVLEALVGAWNARGVTGILLEAPENTRYDEIKGATRLEYEEEIRKFADKNGVAYWDLNPEVGLVPEDFVDHVHLTNRAARFRFQAAFLRKVAASLKEEAARKPRPPKG